MGLRGQDSARGYAMAALLVMLGVMSIMMTAALPAWRFQAKREKELELVFRGEQYVKAIERYERKMGAGMRPPSIDVLVQQRFLRKKYKDPMTKDGEFQPLFIGANNPTAPGQRGGGRGGRGGPNAPDEAPPGMPPLAGTVGPGGQGGPGGILGVVSKSKESSIRTYRGRTKYNEWQFVYAGAANRPGGPGGQGAPGMGGRGQPRPGLPGERGGRSGRGFPGPGRGGFGPGGGRGPGGSMRGPGQ